MTKKPDSWFVKKLRELHACRGAISYARRQRSFRAAWENCDRLDWVEWLVISLFIPHGTSLQGCRACKWQSQNKTLNEVRRRFPAERVSKALRKVQP